MLRFERRIRCLAKAKTSHKEECLWLVQRVLRALKSLSLAPDLKPGDALTTTSRSLDDVADVVSEQTDPEERQ